MAAAVEARKKKENAAINTNKRTGTVFTVATKLPAPARTLLFPSASLHCAICAAQ